MMPLTTALTMGRVLLSLLLVMMLSVPVMAKDHASLLASAEAQYRSRQYDAAKVDATRARELAQSPEQQISADLLLGQILGRMNQRDAAIETYQAVLGHPDAALSDQARARLGISGVLIAKRQYAAAREVVEPVIGMDVPVSLKNHAQRDVLRCWWGYSDWRTLGDRDALQQAVEAILAEPGEAWPGRHVRVLQDAGNLTRAGRAYAAARAYYQRVLSMEPLSAQTIVSTLENIARTYVEQGHTAEARQTLKQALQVQGIRPNEQASVLRALAGTFTDTSESAAARELLDQALALEGLPAGTQAQILSDLCDTWLREQAVDQAAGVVDRLLNLEGAPTSLMLRKVTQLADLAVALDRADLGDAYHVRLLDRELAPAQQQTARTRLFEIRLSREDYTGAQQALAPLVELEGQSAAERLTTKLQVAGSLGAGGQMEAMQQQVEQALADDADLPAADRIRALWDATKPLFAVRAYEPVRALLAHVDRFAQQGVKSYTVRSVQRAPVDVGGWLASGLLDDPASVDARFYPYSQQDAAALLAVDVRADRPLADPGAEHTGPAETSFAMVYDARGWHIYVHAAEPMIDQIMAKNGQGGSSLEMFFTPGVGNEPYYQWIIRLATGEVSIYDWSSPHRHYRTLQSRDGYFKVNTVALDDGWGTAIFISWEAFYDQLPLLAGDPQVWRFSMQRWDPSGSVTWGGRVHETGRWGHILFEPPSESQRLAMQRHLIQRAWWHYQTTVQQQATFWSGARGDLTFYQQVIEPMVQAVRDQGDIMAAVEDWDAAALEAIYQQSVPHWQEVGYDIDQQRLTYLRSRLLGAE